MKKFSCVLIALIAISLLLCGCYDSREIDETAYLIALGIDAADSGGFTYTLQFSAPLATVEGGGGGGGGEEEKKNATVTNLSISAPDFYTAKNMTNNFLSKSINMSHLKLIVFSKAVDEHGFLHHSRFLLREREIRPHTAVAVTAGKAKGYLEAVNPRLEANTAKYYELMALRSNNVYSPNKKLSRFVDEIRSSDGISVLPVAHSGEKIDDENPLEITAPWVNTSDFEVHSKEAGLQGMAIFKNGKIISVDTGSGGMLYNIITGGIKNCTVSLKNPYAENEILSFGVNIPEAASYKIDNKKKPCRITVNQGFDVDFYGGTLPTGFKDNGQVYAFAKGCFQKAFSEFFYDLSRNKKADIINLDKYFRMQFLTENSPELSDWSKIFETAEFEFNIDFFEKG